MVLVGPNSGKSIGAKAPSVEVFNHFNDGYQNTNRPSYSPTIVTLASPLAIPALIVQTKSRSYHAQGLIVATPLVSNKYAQETLSDYLKRHIVAIAVDTRKLTRLLREKGAQNLCIIVGEHRYQTCLSRSLSWLKGMDLAKTVTVSSRTNGLR